MHCNNVVVALVDDNKRPIREHESKRLGSSPSKRENGEIAGRSSKVLMPFESEFKILVKNQNDCRIKLDITIDGANVSGNGLILDANSSDYIERSVDVAQKFKFVSANHEDVADPTNPENGNIVITVWKEKVNSGWKIADQWNKQPTPFDPKPYFPNPYDKSPYIPKEPNISPPPVWCRDDSSVTVKGLSDSSCTVNACSYSSTIEGQAGAVVDGDYSNQEFGKTFWNGNDGFATKFIFYIRGADAHSISEQERELSELERLMKKFNVNR